MTKGWDDFRGIWLKKEKKMERPTCCDCGKTADQIWPAEVMEDQDPDAYARDDGTYNRVTNHFCCDMCYINRGCPSAPPPGWKAP